MSRHIVTANNSDNNNNSSNSSSNENGSNYRPLPGLGLQDNPFRASISASGEFPVKGNDIPGTEPTIIHETQIEPGPTAGSPEIINQVVTELVYVHCKLLIVDDRIVVMGSANINDRSMVGNRDSEVAMILEDTEMVDSFMDGKPYRAAKFAHVLRTQLCREHIGAMDGVDQRGQVIEQFEGKPPVDMTLTDADKQYLVFANKAVVDPLSAEFTQLWWGTAANNASIFREVFRCVPDDNIHTYDQYHKFVPGPTIPIDHAVLENTTIPDILTKLKKVRGHLVPNPQNFFEGRKPRRETRR